MRPRDWGIKYGHRLIHITSIFILFSTSSIFKGLPSLYDYFDHHILRESKIFLETTLDDLFNYSTQVLYNVPLGVAMLLAMRWAFFGRSSNDVTGITSSDLATGTSICVPTGTT